MRIGHNKKGLSERGVSMTYYQKKAIEIHELSLSAPWNDDEAQKLVVLLKQITRDQRHACAEATHRLCGCNCHGRVMNAMIGESTEC